MPNYLPPAFYLDEDVVALARQLLGKVLCTRMEGQLTAGYIIEAEAYRGPDDRASHAWNGRRTQRTEPMFAAGGIAYVYLCYGLHHLFNVVTGPEGLPHAVLIRALYPAEGLETMLRRRKMDKPAQRLCNGPATLTQALAIRTAHTATPLNGNKIWIEDRGIRVPDRLVETTTRIGIDYAGEDAKRPWRFRVREPVAEALGVKPLW